MHPSDGGFPAPRDDNAARLGMTTLPLAMTAGYRNRTQTGLATSTDDPVGVRRPDSASTRKLTIVSDFWFAVTKNRPVGSSEKLRGALPPLGTCCTGDSWPLV